MQRLLVILSIGVVVVVVAWARLGRREDPVPPPSPPTPVANAPSGAGAGLDSTSVASTGHASPPLSDDELEKRIRMVCSHCHAYSAPGTNPKGLWEKELQQAYRFIAERELPDDRVPPYEQTLAYFESRAPEEFPVASQPNTPSPLEFRPRHYDVIASQDREKRFPLPLFPGVANVNAAPLFADARLNCVLADMRSGHIYLWRNDAPESAFGYVGAARHPAHSAVVDLDADGLADILVADLGKAATSDEKRGQVLWFRQTADGQFSATPLLDKVGRVADAQAADFDADGDLDLVVAEFGGHLEGHIRYLENQTTDYAQPKFVSTSLDDRTGGIHVPIADLNGDGRPDIVALISQEFEQIVAFINDGPGSFRQELVYDPQNPGYGSAGIDLADVDGDGDQDVVYINGDTLDFPVYRPDHSVQWLENKGTFPFTHHHLAAFAGGTGVKCSDLDGDGDLDIVASAFLPFGILDPKTGKNVLGRMRMPSLIWLEQVRPREFDVHVLEENHYSHATVECADVDADGDQDLVTGHFTLEQLTSRGIHMNDLSGILTIWENQLRSRQPSE